MESAKKALGVTKYFMALPPIRHLAALMLALCIVAGAIVGAIKQPELGIWALVDGAGAMLVSVFVPSMACAVAVAALRRRVQFSRAMALSLISAFVYSLFYVLSAIAQKFHPAGANITFVGFGIAFLLWFFSLKFIFGLERSAWLFAAAQMVGYALFVLAGTSLSIFSAEAQGLMAKVSLAAIVFVSALYAILFITSGPLKKNLGLSSPDVISMFASQWLYGEKDLEEAFDEMGDVADTFVGVAVFRTESGEMRFIVPYIHFGPFGNLGGSQFSYQIEQEFAQKGVENFVFHGTATHDLDPVNNEQLSKVSAAIRKALMHAKPASAKYSHTLASAGDSTCHLLSINNCAIASFTRAPLSTEDVNLAIGWALMEKAQKKFDSALVIDCHNAETGDVDYVEAGSPIASEMYDSLEAALGKKTRASPLLAGWACEKANHISGIASGGVKVCALGSKNSFDFIILIDANGITQEGRERLIASAREAHPQCNSVEVYTTDTHELNTIRGVFNPSGASMIGELEEASLRLCKLAHEKMLPAKFAMKKERFSIKVLGPYQSAEIVSTLNSVFSILKLAIPIGLAVAIVALLWLLTQIS